MAIKINYEKNGYKYYRETRTIGKKSDGSPVKKEFLGKTKTEADEKANNYMQMIKRGVPFDFENITVAEFFKKYLFDVLIFSNKIKSSTFERYECLYRKYIENSEIGILKVYNISSSVIQDYYNKLYKNGKTSSLINSLNKLLSKFFNYCIENNYIHNNPCSKKIIEIPGNADSDTDEDELKDISFFSEDEYNKIINNLDFAKTYHMIFFFASILGLRLGEILALKNKYVDVQNKIVKIRYTLSYVKIFKSSTVSSWKLQLQKPKSKSSVRDVNIPNNAIKIIKEFINNQNKKYIENNITFDDDSLIFTTKDCKAIDKKNLRTAWKRYLNKIGIDYKKFHTLRHTFASILFKSGASLLEVKNILGHSDSKITEKIYIHIFPESKKTSINKLNIYIPKITKSGKSREIKNK